MGRRREFIAHLCGPIERTKLAVVVSNVGQAPKVEDLVRSEHAGYDELAREANTAVLGGAACSGDESGGSSHHRA